MNSRILIVDDEPNILQGLQRMLRSYRDRCEFEFAGGAAEALDVLARVPCDAVISDLRMPGMDGAELLWEVRERSPASLRVILTGQTDRQVFLKSVEPAHQYLTKPCSPEVLRASVERVLELPRWLPDPSLRVDVGRLCTVPGSPHVVGELRKELAKPEPSVDRVVDLFSRGIAISAKLYQIATCALSATDFEPGEAARQLGMGFLRDLSLLPQVFRGIDPARVAEFGLEDLMRSERPCMEEIGRLVLVEVRPEECLRILASGLPRMEAERRILGVTHAEVGAYLLALWGFPERMVAGIAAHAD